MIQIVRMNPFRTQVSEDVLSPWYGPESSQKPAATPSAFGELVPIVFGVGIAKGFPSGGREVEVAEGGAEDMDVGISTTISRISR